jgi:hypothetical protein
MSQKYSINYRDKNLVSFRNEKAYYHFWLLLQAVCSEYRSRLYPDLKLEPSLNHFRDKYSYYYMDHTGEKYSIFPIH